MWNSTREFAYGLCDHIVHKWDNGEPINPLDILDRITDAPEFDNVWELCEGLGIFPKPIKPRFEAATECLTDVRSKLEKQLRRFVRGALNWHWNGADKLMLAEHSLHAAFHVDVGVGKTHQARIAVEKFIQKAKKQKAPHRVLWLVPHHDLSSETAKEFESSGNVTAAIWRGREALDPADPDGKAKMCMNLGAVKDVQKVQGDVSKHACGNLDGHHCPLLASCAFQHQKGPAKTADILIAANNALFTQLDMQGVGLVVIDEAFWQRGVLGDRRINLATFASDVALWPVRGDTSTDDTAWLVQMCNALEKLCLGLHEGEFLSARHLVGMITADDALRAGKLEWKRKLPLTFQPGMPPADREAIRDNALVNATLASRAAVWTVARHLLNGDGDEGRLQRTAKTDSGGSIQQIILRSIHQVRDSVLNLPVMLLDATYPESIVRAFFPDAVLDTRARAEMPNMRIRQILGSNREGFFGGFGKSSLTVDSKKKPEENKRIARRIAEIVEYVKLHRKGSALVITYQDFEQHFAGIDGVATAHFNNVAGLDDFKHVDSLFVIGRPFPQAEETWGLAVAITGRKLKHETPETRPAGVLMRDGSATAIQSRGYIGDDLEGVCRAICEAEVIQSIGRGRGVLRGEFKPLNVHYFGDVVLPFAVDEVRVWKEVAPNVLDQMWLRGGVAWSAQDAAALYSDLFANEGSARKALQRVEVRDKSLYNTLIGDCPAPLDLFRPFTPRLPCELTYQRAGAGQRPRKATVPKRRVDEFIERLKAIHGADLLIVRRE